LELVAMTGRNSGHVDVAAATSRGVLVTDTDGSGAAPVELTMGLIIAAARGISLEDRNVRNGGWQVGMGMELAGRTLGILGFGRIGTKIAAFGQFLGMHVIAAGPTLTTERAAAAGVTAVSMDDLFRTSDIVSVHLRLVPQTRRIVAARHFALMKPTACFVNTARGGLIDEAALVEALRARRFAAAGLDVYETEPLPADHPLRELDNVVLTPHLGYVTVESYELFFRGAVENIARYLDGEIPPRALNPEVLGSRFRA
jgi:phosphoglycerate dehydrogenase-like enzyme